MVDLLDVTLSRNRRLIETTAQMHQEGIIPPGTFVLDLDSIRNNARAIAETASREKVRLYYMSKQFGRNPIICKVIVDAGIHKAVAIDIDECIFLHKYGFEVGHVGHLSQVPERFIRYVLEEVKPEVVTVYSFEKGSKFSAVSASLGVTQGLLLRVRGESDFSYPEQISPGGIDMAEFEAVAKKLAELKGVSIEGVTTFPAFRTDLFKKQIFPLPNIESLLRVARAMRRMGLSIGQINMPADNSSVMFYLASALVRDFGWVATLEPGHAFTGTTPLHAVKEDLPELPSIIYLSEVSHVEGKNAYAYGGGMMGADNVAGVWSSDYHNHYMHAVCGHEPSTIGDQMVLAKPVGFIDYYIPLRTGVYTSYEPSVGDTVIMGFRTQAFVTRAKIAVIKGITKSKPELVGIFDSRGNALETDTFLPLAYKDALALIGSN